MYEVTRARPMETEESRTEGRREGYMGGWKAVRRRREKEEESKEEEEEEEEEEQPEEKAIAQVTEL